MSNINEKKEERQKDRMELHKNEMRGPRFPYVAVDFDGSLCEDRFPDIGEPKEKCIDYVKRLAREGSKIILYTCRENGTRKLLDEAVDFCRTHEIPLFAVNENPDNKYPAMFGLAPDAGRKMHADLYIDDKAVNALDINGFELEPAVPSAAPAQLPEGGHLADEHWIRVMRLAEAYGFILIAAGGTAILATNAVQLETQGMKEYARIQRMNGRCPKKLGLAGCIDSMTGEAYCNGQCELHKKL